MRGKVNITPLYLPCYITPQSGDGAVTDAYTNVLVDAGAVSAAADEIAEVEGFNKASSVNDLCINSITFTRHTGCNRLDHAGIRPQELED